jgi:3-hydroxyisobutyrate dehydrogenase-like beta-hydroxyacid dehydrogenase
MEKPTVGFIGLGLLGLPMARAIARAGFPMRVYNRTPAKAASVEELGAVRVDAPRDTATPGGVVVTVVTDDRALREVTEGANGFLGALGEGGVHISASTIAPSTARDLAARHAEKSEHYLASPVFGRGDAAEAGKLRICVAGAEEAKSRARPVLEALGDAIFDFGEDPSAANVVKLAGNFLIAGAVEAMAEAFAMAEKNGVAPQAVHDFFSQTLFACPIYQSYGRMIVNREYEPAGFSLPLGLKDVQLFENTGYESRVPTPLASLLRERMIASLAKGRGQMDWTSFALEVSEAAGL